MANDANVQTPLSCSLKNYADIKKISTGLLGFIGLADDSIDNNPAIRIPYFNYLGEEIGIHYRKKLENPPGTIDAFCWKGRPKRNLYGLWWLRTYDSSKNLFLVGGESDSHTLWNCKNQALGIPGFMHWSDDWAEHLLQFERIYLVMSNPDHDLKYFTHKRLNKRLRIIKLEKGTDLSDIYVKNPSAFSDTLDELVKNSVKLVASEKEHITSDDGLSEISEAIANMPNILNELSKKFRSMGIVGEVNNLKLLYLAMTSRLWKKPVSIAIKGKSSSGKTFLVQSILRFFPKSAYLTYTAMSEKALVFSDDSLKNKVIVLYELAGLKDMATVIMRSLLSEGHIRYQTTEAKQNGYFSKSIEKEGPTGLITTSTNLRFSPDEETRLISVRIDESPIQTERIVKATLLRRNYEVDLSEWITFQQWLETIPRKVEIPFGEVLLNLIPCSSLRMRRDIDKILTLLEVHAFLHHKKRKKTADGKIIAELTDYEAIRMLVKDRLETEMRKAKSLKTNKDVLSVVSVVKDLFNSKNSPVTNKEIGEKLNLKPDQVSRSVKKAIKLGLLINQDDNRGKTNQLVPNEDEQSNPETHVNSKKSQLPTVDDIKIKMQNGGSGYSSPQDNNVTVSEKMDLF